MNWLENCGLWLGGGGGGSCRGGQHRFGTVLALF